MIGAVVVALVVCFARTVEAAAVLQVAPIVSVSEMYDDNILMSPTDVKGDFVTAALLGGYADLSTPLSDTQLQYMALAEKFANYSQYDNVGAAQYFVLKHKQELSPETKLTLNDDYLQGDLTAGFGVGTSVAFNPGLGQTLLQGSGYWMNDASGSLKHDFGDGITSNFSLSQMTFHSNGVGYSFEQGGTGGFQYELSDTLSLGAADQFYDFRFSNFPAAESNWPQLTLNWQPTAQIKGSVYAGPAVEYTLSGPAPTHLYPGYLVSLSYSAEKWTAQVGGGETPMMLAGLGGAGVSEGGSGSFNYALGQYTSFTADASYAKYFGGGFNGDYYAYGAEIKSQLQPWLMVFVQYAGIRRGLGGGTPAAALATGLPIGTQAVINIYMVGATVSFDLIKSAI